jgi:hypothetical protein
VLVVEPLPVHAAPQISLSPIFGPPGTIVTVTGSGFTVSAQPYCNFVSNPSGLVGPIQGTDFVCNVALDGSIATAWFRVVAGASGSYSVTVTYLEGQVSTPVQSTADDSLGGPVGGVVLPITRSVVIAPYLALFGMVALVAVVVAAPWKKKTDTVSR